MSKTETRFDYLDLIRGLAALQVLGGHLRNFVFQNYHHQLGGTGASLGVATKLFYFVTGLGHQSVLIFFALSGFLVGGKALSDMLNAQFSWPSYLLRRLTRLWIVIVPTLLLTLLLDRIGIWLTDGVGYDGRYFELYTSGPNQPPAAIDDSSRAFFGNVAFLQDIAVPTFGSNSPMWSLANEFWYYIVFAFAAWLALARLPMLARIFGFVVLLLSISFLPTSLWEGGAIWAAGAGAAWLSRKPALLRFFTARCVRIFAIILLFGALVIAKAPNIIALGDLGFGIAVACALPIIANFPSLGGVVARAARASSELSYTLYLTHFPLLTCIFLSGVAPAKWPPSAPAWGIFTVGMLVAIAWAAAIWWCFERNTDRVYTALARKLLAPPPMVWSRRKTTSACMRGEES